MSTVVGQHLLVQNHGTAVGCRNEHTLYLEESTTSSVDVTFSVFVIMVDDHRLCAILLCFRNRTHHPKRSR